MTDPCAHHAVPLLLLDLDGTVRYGRDELGHFVHDAHDVHLFTEAVPLLKAWKGNGGRILGISNQGGVALGHTTWEDMRGASIITNQETGGLFDDIGFCPHHPSAEDPLMRSCWCRKPAPGLAIMGIVNLMNDHLDEVYQPARTLLVGDRPEDQACAEALGVAFLPADQWRAGAYPPPFERMGPTA
jgi:D-glycero-D-manno-heptose 1,7-bisphosphate phosphatase